MDNEQTNNDLIQENEQVPTTQDVQNEQEGPVVEQVNEQPQEVTVVEENNVYTHAEQVNNVTSEQNYGPRNIYSDIPMYTEVKKPNKRGRFWIAATAVLTAVCLITSSFAIGTVFGRDSVQASSQSKYTDKEVLMSQTPEYSYTTQLTENDKLDIPSLVEKVNPTVVDIVTSSSEGGSLGTGIIFSEDGYIVTCAHVIDDATEVYVYLYQDDTEYEAEIIGYDTYSDIGVIKIDKTGLTAAEFGQSHNLVPGEQVVAIGTPYSRDLSHTITEGIVSSRRDNYSISDLNVTLDLIQHTATINPGNSGGPLFNMYGQVVGINSVKIMAGGYTTYEDIGFAIQSESALPIINQLISSGKVRRPQMGIKGMTDSTLGGVYVGEVIEDSAAEEAGLKVGDLITKVNGERVLSIDELISMLGKFNFGDEIEVTILRGVDVYKLTLTLQEPIDE